MAYKGKILVTDDGRIDLSAYRLDDQRLSDLLVRENLIKPGDALDVSRFMRDAIEELQIHTITAPMIEEVLKAKLLEYGLTQERPIKLDKSVFIKNGLALTENAQTVLKRRYLKKDQAGKPVETPAHMFRRVAHHIACAEQNYGSEGIKQQAIMEERFYEMMTSLDFLPNSPTLMNAGRSLGQLAACFVLPVEDSMEEIFDSLKNAAIIHKSGGGTGFSFSRLRPKNSQVGTTGGIASGPVSFMKIFNTATEQVKQGGTRRGANMAILRVDHPDIMEFIDCKRDNGELNNFNISVGITEAFMQAVKSNGTYNLIDPRSKEKVAELNAADVYQALVERAWENGDPGIIFLDRLNRDNPTPAIGEIESTNPCGEQPLLPMEACNLGSINLSRFVIQKDGHPCLDFARLKEIVGTAVRFLDNTIDMSKYPLPRIEQMVKGNRKIGLGVMGFADMLYQLKIPYNSDKALETAEQVMGFIQQESHAASKSLAAERGPFANFELSVFKDQPDCVYRNATTTTIAPTGTLSIIANCSSGVEPLFALSFVRNVMDNDRLLEVNPCFEAVAKERGFFSEELMNAIAKSGSIQHLETIPAEVKAVFVTAHDILPEWHIRMQAAFQKYTDNAVSKTVNLPHDATVGDVMKIYDLAHELQCKGVTIYRDGSKERQVLSFAKADKADKAFLTAVRDRPETLEGFTTKVKTGLGQLYVTVTEFDGKPFEVFATIGKSGRSTTAKTEAIGRLVSLALRSGVKVDKIVEQLKGIGGEHPIFQEGGLVLSIPDAIARVLEKRYMAPGSLSRKAYGKSLMGETCPECGQTISFEEGCMTCHFCGYNKCG
jgi:ribonucleoside-diphosphate reductase alpha chain